MRDQVPAAASVGAAPEAAALAALPNSAMRHLGATTTPEQFFFDLLQPAAMQVLDEEEDIWADAYAPLLGPSLSEEARALSTACINALHDAFGEGSKSTTAEQATAWATFTARARCPLTSVELFTRFKVLYTPPLPEHLEIAWDDLWQYICDAFIADNGKPTVTVAAATEDGDEPPTERDERWALPRAAAALRLHNPPPCLQADWCLSGRVDFVQGAQGGPAVRARCAPRTMARQALLAPG